eukprot:CAMPEP_0170100070 /NCGR_PEP_ID=MMETSP0020_2-20130122/1426_1 /TAXON_ID=98059 /ORGANISM="Dinobryon sp., Strain UTEXLB2267" /LENGTH=279 /DNA_ID=CAMNT_0010322869 /DNA_START=257 /DNA_END=1097 /DNA_ORIENTATION=+
MKCLCPSIKPIELSSPSIISNVFTPHGCFSIGFWIYIPAKSINSSPKAVRSDDKEFVTINHSLSIHLIIGSDDSAYLQLSTFVLDADPSFSVSNASQPSTVRSKAFKNLTVKSDSLPRDNWVSCVVELSQDAVTDRNDVTKDKNVWSSSNNVSLPQRNEKTCIAMFIDGVLTQQAETNGGRSPLHQNIIVGKIPSRLGEQSSSKSVVGGSDVSSRVNGRNEYDEAAHVLVADVFWVPSSVFTVSTDLSTQLSDSVAKSTTKRTTRYFDDGIPSCPPTYL